MSNPFPLRYVHGNILVGTGGECAALYRVTPVSYPFHRDKHGWAGRLRLFAHEVEADFSLYRVNRLYSAEEYVEQGMKMLDNRYGTAEVWRKYLQGQQKVLRDRHSFAPEIYIAVRLNPKDKESLGGISRDFYRFRDQVESFLGIDKPRAIPSAELDALIDSEENVYGRVKQRLPARRATTREVQWLLRRPAYRGMAEPPMDDYWKPNALVVEKGSGEEFEPQHTDIMKLGDTPVRERGGILEVGTEDGVLYQAMLTLGALPDDCLFPDESEYLFTPLEKASFPVDMVMHVEWIDNRTAVAKVRKKIRDADTLLGEQEESSHGSLSWTPEEDAIQARNLDRRLRKSDQPPLLRASISFAVAAESPATLRKRVGSLRSHFGTVRIDMPVGAQVRLFFDHILRTDGGRYRHHRDWITTVQFAALMPIATHDVGSRRGAHFAYIQNGSRRSICVDPTEAPSEARASAILFAGTQGGGKTTAAELMCILAALRGSMIITVDPKPDHALEFVPELKGRWQIIDFDDPDDYEGWLDPLVVLPVSRRVDGSMSYYMDLLGTPPDTWKTQIRKAVIDVTESMEMPCSNAVIERLMRPEAGEEAHAAGDALATWARAGLGKFGFSNGVAHSLDTRQVTTIRPSALALPDATVPRSEYDEVERVSVATFRLVGNFAMRMVNDDRTINKLLLLDEAHFFLASNNGRRLISDVNRQGRAKNVRLLLASQHVADPGEVAKLVGTMLIFGMETTDEARDAIQLMGLDRNDDVLAEALRSQRKGRCFIRDIHSYIAQAQVDVVYDHLLRCLDTTPGAQRKKVAA